MAEGAAEASAESGGDGASGVSASERGVAPIKPQYLTTKEGFHGFLEAQGQEKLPQETEAGNPDGSDGAEPEAKRIRLENGQTEEAAEPGEQPQAQKRARGQNKVRPHMKPTHYDKNRLCPSLVQESPGQCFFGDRCRFLHDVSLYLESKPPDLGPRCVLFETFGRCPYGVTCRFAGAHLGPEGQNLLTAPEDDSGRNHCATQRDPVGLGAGTPPGSPVRTCGPLTDEDTVRLRACEKRLDIGGKLYLAPLTTCGNLPFRRICKRFGADVTCGEMAMCTNLLQGQMSEWALLKRHACEDIFGVQLAGAFPDTMTKCAELLSRTVEVDFVDINVGCPIDLVYKKPVPPVSLFCPPLLCLPAPVAVAAPPQLHGRSREQRYTKLADWQYIQQCVEVASPMPLFGNGDILSYEDANRAKQTGVAGIMIARGALLKPWLFTEIKEQRHWDISSSERLDILRDFTHYGLEHWGSDTQGVEKTRRFLLEWLSFLCRYVPVGLLELLPQRINERPPYYLGRDYLETLMASQQAADWIRISEMLLGPVPPDFAFLPKHKANAYK
ncbi:tRNA-dihydrouridine synthase 3-like [Fukomys damarensis]|uniref:tRNA-dihydrouridine(47) synthase [NAD(P)(+)] n=1 Tax=Fukomys damarensis TaxID=885580 RepID=A0A091DEA6_FUKDA|nr:tRNA-dihydrouridine synthase 3-like [Fukomys damarensis]